MALLRKLKMRHLHVLVALDENRHLGRTAGQLHTSQPAVSRTLHEIEAAVSQTLFVRTPKGTIPTAAGEAMIRHARQALQVLRNAEQEMAVLAEGLNGQLRIGTNYSSAAHMVPQALILLCERAPRARLSLHEGSLDGLLPQLLERKLDLIVARSDHRLAQEGLKFRKVAEEPMTVVTGYAHPLARRRNLRWADLEGFPWILPLPGNPVRDALDAILLHEGLPRSGPTIECGSSLANCVLLNGTRAISVVPRSVAQHYKEAALLAILPLCVTEVFSPVGLITADDSQAALVTLFEKCLKRVVARRARRDHGRGGEERGIPRLSG